MQNIIKHFDVIICGAGPAGCTSALALSDSGLNVALIDKKQFSNDKICGGALAAYIPKVLNTINPKFAQEFLNWELKNPVNTSNIIFDHKTNIKFKYHENGFIIKRSDFDSFLLNLVHKTGKIEIIKDTQIVDVYKNNSLITVVTKNNQIYSCNLILGCDGANSIVRKKLSNLKIDKNNHATAVRAFYKNVKGMESDTFELHFLKEIRPAYLWVFPMKDSLANVGIGLPTHKVIKNKVNLKKLLNNTIESNNYLKARFSDAELIGNIEGAPLPLCSKKLKISGEMYMLCGDAASIIDPLSGEGIGQAMISGRYAAWHAIKCFKNNKFDDKFMSEYDSILYQKIWKLSRNRNFIKKLITYFPALIKLIVSVARKNKRAENLIKNFIN